MERDKTIPGAILLGSIIIGAGLFFGLRGRAPASLPAAGTASMPAVTGGAHGAGPAGSVDDPLVQGAQASPGGADMGMGAPGGLGMLTAPPEIQAKVVAQASKALKAMKPTFLKTCWAPAVKQTPEPAKAKYNFNITFDGKTGKELSRGISESREMSRGDVGQCLRTLPLSLSVDPPGMNVNVDLPLELP